MVDLSIFKSSKHWKIKAFERYTEHMTFEEGKEFTDEVVKAIIASKPKLAKYDSDFFEKLGYSRDGIGQYAWDSFKKKRFKTKHNLDHEGSSDLYNPVFLRRIQSYVTGSSIGGILDALMMDKKLSPRYEAKSSLKAKKLIIELRRFFDKQSNVGDSISDEQLAVRIANNIDTGFTTNYIIYLLKHDDSAQTTVIGAS